MSDPENFLERWSRRKREAVDETTTTQNTETPDPAKAAAEAPRNAGKPATTPGASTSPPSPAFDLSKLPSLESITAATDVRAFLAPGVPQGLARAALRRAWAADPAIRDFVGLAENSWDFTKPDGAPGFGDLPADLDLKKLVAQVFGDGPQTAEAAVPQPPSISHPEPSQNSESTEEQAVANPGDGSAAGNAGAETGRLHSNPGVSDGSQEDATAGIVQGSNIIAMHNSAGDLTTVEPKKRRQHGGALPD